MGGVTAPVTRSKKYPACASVVLSEYFSKTCLHFGLLCCRYINELGECTATVLEATKLKHSGILAPAWVVGPFLYDVDCVNSLKPDFVGSAIDNANQMLDR